MQPGRASSTARLIAAAMVAAHHDPQLRDFVPSDAADWSERLLRTDGGCLLRLVRSRYGRAVARIIERLTLPGIVRHWVLRKHTIEQLGRAAASEGYSQLMVLGTGLDSLAFRVSHDGTFARVISVDHPSSQRVVRDVVGAGSVILVAADLSLAGSVEAAVTALDPSLSTLIVIEGVLMYLDPEQVRRLLTILAELSCPRTRLIATYMNQLASRSIGFEGQGRVIAAWLRWRGEPMRWASTESDLSDLVKRTGWMHVKMCPSAEEMGRHFPAVRGLEGEDIVVAETYLRVSSARVLVAAYLR